MRRPAPRERNVFILLGHARGLDAAGTFALATGYLAVLTPLFSGLDDLLVEVMGDEKRSSTRFSPTPSCVLRSVPAYLLIWPLLSATLQSRSTIC